MKSALVLVVAVASIIPLAIGVRDGEWLWLASSALMGVAGYVIGRYGVGQKRRPLWEVEFFDPISAEDICVVVFADDRDEAIAEARIGPHVTAPDNPAAVIRYGPPEAWVPKRVIPAVQG